MRAVAIVALALVACPGAPRSPARAAAPRVVLAVFAHPDDETVVGPVLARYAREGAKVYLAIATDGEKGVNDRAGIAAGEPLAKVRRGEASCACKELGIAPPILFGLRDGELGAMTEPLGRDIQIVADRVAKLVADLRPDLVLTWGPDGGYGHPDHRLVSDAVTQAIQARGRAPDLLYVGFTPEAVKLLDTVWAGSLVWIPTDARYLTVHVTFTPADEQASRRAIACHASQFAPEEIRTLEDALDGGWKDGVRFRAWR